MTKTSNIMKQFVKRMKESVGDPAAPSVEELINKTIVENPTMNAATFYNTLKSLGIQFTKVDAPAVPEPAPVTKTEADSTSTVPQMLRAKESKKFSFRTNKFIEAMNDEKPKDGMVGFVKFGTILIQEGMGNFGTSYFYTKEALKSAIPVFEGRKSFADHPTSGEESERPERSVRDVLGYFKNVRYQESETGRGQLLGDLVIPPDKPFDWARSLMTMAVRYSEDYPDKDFVGMSINASGDAVSTPIERMIESGVCDEVKAKMLKARDEHGIKDLDVVYKFDEAVSCDLVTEAGAAGKIKQLMEGNHEMKKSKAQKLKEAEEKKLLATKALKEADEAKKEAEEAPADGAGDGSAAAGHDDAEQDAALIKKMIAKYMSADDAASEEECGIVKEAYEANKELGLKEEEAASSAVHTLKMSKHMANKQAKREAEEKAAKEAAKTEADAAAVMETDGKPEDPNLKDIADKNKKESAGTVSEINKLKESVATLQGENTALKSKLGQYDIQNHIEKICKESGLKTEATKKFREAVSGIKVVAEIDKTWKIWKSAHDAVNDSVVVHNFSESIAHNGEKQVSSGSGEDFADSIKN